VNAVAPGLTETQMGTGNFPTEMVDQIIRDGPISNLLGRVSQPEDIADTVLFLCLPASRQITGQTIHVSAGAIV
jgi:NAD(P)-dependent dehydrogenase (short-subunit alcohol dehydrogenase family)